MKVQSTRFGELNIADNDILQFVHGIPGFPQDTKFAYLPYGDESPFAFLQSLRDPDLAFLIVEPFSILPDYSFALDEENQAELDLSEDRPPQVFNIVSIKETLEKSTVNLLAPILVNWQTRQAKQIILDKSSYTTKHLLFPNGLPKQPEGGK